ncbi:MAG TPA: amidohydrolase family protein, partial [Bacillota bacterium]
MWQEGRQEYALEPRNCRMSYIISDMKEVGRILPDGTDEMVIDIHAHFLPRWCADELFGAQGVPEALCDLSLQLATMDAQGIDLRVVSPPPAAFTYREPEATFAARLNEELAAAVGSAGRGARRFLGLATVPLHRPREAAQELRRAIGERGLRGAAIGSCVADRELDDPQLEPFWDAAEELGAVLLLHPSEVPGAQRMASYHLRNLVGNPSATALAAARLIFGGVLDRHPRLNVILAHGGGALPWILARLDHGYAVRPECASACAEKPSAYLRRFYYDTVLFGDEERAWLCERVGR